MKQRVPVADQTPDAPAPSRHHTAERRHDPGEIVVTLCLLEGERRGAEIQLDPLRVGLGDHSRGLERPLSLGLHYGVRVPIARLGQGDGLIGALEATEQLAGRHSAPQVHQNGLDDPGGAGVDRGIVLHVELRRYGEREIHSHRVGGDQRAGGHGPARGLRHPLVIPVRGRTPAGNRCQAHHAEGVSPHDHILHHMSRTQRTGPRRVRVTMDAGSVSIRAWADMSGLRSPSGLATAARTGNSTMPSRPMGISAIDVTLPSNVREGRASTRSRTVWPGRTLRMSCCGTPNSSWRVSVRPRSSN